MKFISIYANHADGTRYCLFVRPVSFDVDRWVKSRGWALRLLGVTAITVCELDTEES
jgi:hypothetical protein